MVLPCGRVLPGTYDSFVILAIVENEGDKSSHLRQGMEKLLEAGCLDAGPPAWQSILLMLNKLILDNCQFLFISIHSL